MDDISNIIHQLEQQQSAIERALSALREVSGSGASSGRSAAKSSTSSKPRKRVLSAEGRKRIADATRARWAAKRAADAAAQGSPKKKATKRKRAGAKKSAA